MIEVNDIVDSNYGSHFDQEISGKSEVMFVRCDAKPLQVYENWKDERQGYGPSGSSVDVGYKRTVAIPMEFYSLRTHKGDETEQVKVRYYANKTLTTQGNIQVTLYDAGQGSPSYIFTGDSIKLNVKTTEGRELFRMFMAHPMNAEFPTKGPKKVPLFRLVRPEESAKKANEREVKIAKAIALLYDENQLDDSALVKIHKYLRSTDFGVAWQTTDELVASSDFDIMKSQIAMYAKAHTDEFMKLAATTNIGVLNLIRECADLKIIVKSDNRWIWGDAVKRNIREICDIGVGQDPTDALAYFLVYDKDGKRSHEIMKEHTVRKPSV